ncbi:hypothetical protein ESY86_01350 [Subsaximicrobium wynnwilliamsii]|uniref:Uncharacterized protein n=1 Tax=Subsaximicrobium wynnwilliamsii TaxID=291179 RepID=A0A5C6ZPJ5_9FLAO|nr:hypothetical protein [Subsaximicrobium wynnwilliamsii]TXD85218.1 hypothetical protein ESY87_02520 [Subsaximicrobium wynnwilliamsii]TXD91261.1 hypothetical protein ESY86_01350 [Subsaximicrobium wynnwilliamsii]TXE04654.1 hypothetical protein ESY88_04000 [Subsaximicrobium wynnwilliamsii]
MKSILALFSVILLSTTAAFAQVGIGIETPDASTILHLESTNSGLLLPRLTTAERDDIFTIGPGPANGLTIYNTTTSAVEINIGTSAAPNWSLLTTSTTTGPVLAPSYTTTQMIALPSTPGSLIYNTTESCLFQYKGAPFNTWQSLCEAESSKIVTLYSASPGIIDGDSDFHNFPLGTGDVQEIDEDYYEVDPLVKGRIKVLKAGNYLINASWGIANLKSGTRKYILAVFEGSTRRGYMNRGFAVIPGASTVTDEFGVSGAFQYEFAANAIINVQYYIDNTNQTGQSGGTTDLTGDEMHIGIIKL